MDEKTMLRNLSGRLTSIRSEILKEYTFFGRLLLRLENRFANCGTACTDMTCIAFDPNFANRLSDNELKFVYLHELMHCVLRHCTRNKGKNQYVYNIACDIVVNSLILDTLHLSTFQIDGCEVMHLTPGGKEGREYTAEEVYQMLMRLSTDALNSRYGLDTMDNHGLWGKIINANALDDQWKKNVLDAQKASGSSCIPMGLERQLKDITHTLETNWRQLLHDYIQFDKSDYTYSVPDRRYMEDIFMPSFQENMYGGRLDELWVVIDTSGSVNAEALTTAFLEIRDAIGQVGSVTGLLSFFDYSVSEPTPFESIEELMAIKPVGGGGTSFHAIFQYLQNHMTSELPKLILILTDGYAPFPEESAAMGVDVIWGIIDSDIKPPWGNCVHIKL